MFNQRHEPDGYDNGNNGRSISLSLHGELDSKEAHAFFRKNTALDCRADHRKRNSNCDIRIALPLLRRGVSQIDREEAEDCIVDFINDNVGSTVCRKTREVCQQHQYTADHTCANQCRQNRSEDISDQVNDLIHELALNLQIIFFNDIDCLTLNTGHILYGIEYVFYFVTDNDLELTTLFHDIQNTIDFLDCFLVCFGVILETETHASDAVSERCDVFFSADMFNNLGGCLLIIHKSSL